MSASGPIPERPAEDDSVAHAERRVLGALCGQGDETEGRQIARRALADYRWCEPVHQAIFEVILGFPAASSRTLREQLRARLTRRGFPDFDFESLFEPLILAPGELEQLTGKLQVRA